LWVGAPSLGSRIIVLSVGAGLGILISACTAKLTAICIRDH
jgi:hypothetical protein